MSDEAVLLQAIVDRLERLTTAQQYPTSDRAVPLSEAMKLLGCKRAQIFRLINKGKLQRTERIGKETCVLLSGITALITTPQAKPKAVNQPRRPTSPRAAQKPRFDVEAELAKLKMVKR